MGTVIGKKASNFGDCPANPRRATLALKSFPYKLQFYAKIQLWLSREMLFFFASPLTTQISLATPSSHYVAISIFSRLDVIRYSISVTQEFYQHHQHSDSVTASGNFSLFAELNVAFNFFFALLKNYDAFRVRMSFDRLCCQGGC